MAARYRKKPVEIEAMGPLTHDNRDDIAAWCNGGAPRSQEKRVPAPGRGVATAVVIRTLEGDMRASYGDYVIRGVQGEFYPCKPDIFTATYEPADSATETTREINTPEVRQAIVHELSQLTANRDTAAQLAGRVYVVLDHASAGLPLPGEAG